MENREAIEWLKGSVVSYEVDDKGRPNGNVTCDLTQEVLDMAITALEKQEADRWIPVTERLPEKEGCYLVAIKNDYNRIYSKTAWVGKDVWFKRQDILAWRPLPEAFEVEEEA